MEQKEPIQIQFSGGAVVNSFEIKDLLKQGDYAEVVKHYEDMGDKGTFTEWDYYNYAQALRKLGRCEEGHAVSREGMIKFPDFSMLKGPYCWCLYYMYVRKFDASAEQEENFFKAVRSITKYSECSVYSPYERSVWKMVDYLKDKNSIPRSETAKQIDEYLSLLDPAFLSTEEAVITCADGKERHLASPQEKWYSRKSRVLFDLEAYEDCIALCEEGLQVCQSFHNNTDIWMGNRIASSYIRLGRLDEGEAKLKELLRRKKDWNLYHGLFDICRMRNDGNGALKYGSAAMLAPGEDRAKVRLLADMAAVLKEQGMDGESYEHLLYSKLLREENGWSVKPALLQELEAYGRAPLPAGALRKSMSEFWQSNVHRGDRAYHGHIERVLPNNKAGFIKEDGGASYYFQVHSLHNESVPADSGQAVTFYIQDSYDHKKQEMSKEAVDIERAE